MLRGMPHRMEQHVSQSAERSGAGSTAASEAGDEAAAGNSHDDTRAHIERLALSHASEMGAADIQHIADNMRTGVEAANRRMIH